MSTGWSSRVVERRHRLHSGPELAGGEHRTAEVLAEWMGRHGADEVLHPVGGTGLLAIFEGGGAGDTVVLRAELDALPIQEGGALPHRSTVDGVAHLCGHDGHMAILAAVAARLADQRPARGRLADAVPASGVAMSTVIHARVGEVAFGTAPDDAAAMATLRADSDRVLDALWRGAESAVAEEAERDGLSWTTSVGDTFPATLNHPEAVAVVRAAAAECGMDCVSPSEPLRWSEDFGRYGQRARAALVAIGAGVAHPPLPGPGYDFPDELLEPGARLLSAIVTLILDRGPWNRLHSGGRPP